MTTRVDCHGSNQFIENVAVGRYVREFDLIQLATLVEKPSGQIQNTSRVWYAMESLFMSADLFLESRGIQTMNFEAMHAYENDNPVKPLRAYVDESTRRSTVRVWQEVLMFFFRTHPGRCSSWPEYNLNQAQERAWHRILEILLGPDEDDEDEPEEDEEEVEELVGERSVDREPIPPPGYRERLYRRRFLRTVPKISRLERAILEFCYSLMDDKFYNDETECALVPAMAVTGVSPAGGYMSTKEYTGKLAALSKVG